MLVVMEWLLTIRLAMLKVEMVEQILEVGEELVVLEQVLVALVNLKVMPPARRSRI